MKEDEQRTYVASLQGIRKILSYSAVNSVMFANNFICITYTKESFVLAYTGSRFRSEE